MLSKYVTQIKTKKNKQKKQNSVRVRDAIRVLFVLNFKPKLIYTISTLKRPMLPKIRPTNPPITPSSIKITILQQVKLHTLENLNLVQSKG
jgi:hypothetical protein